jgi:hypothetical protein
LQREEHGGNNKNSRATARRQGLKRVFRATVRRSADVRRAERKSVPPQSPQNGYTGDMLPRQSTLSGCPAGAERRGSGTDSGRFSGFYRAAAGRVQESESAAEPAADPLNGLA